MKYSISAAREFVGKRVIVSLRYIHADGSETYTGLWGVIVSAHIDGLCLRVEGGLDESHWSIPPDLDAFTPARHSYYQLDGYPVIEDVDYEMYWAVALNPDDLQP